MIEWTVSVNLIDDITDARVEAAMDALADLAVAIASTPQSATILVTVADDDSAAALRIALGRVSSLFPHAVILGAALDAINGDPARPAIPPLVGVAEAAEILGVSRQRTSSLAKAGRMPTPVAELASGPVWIRSAVEAVARQPRRPGRPVAVK